MEGKSIKRYLSFQKSLQNLHLSKGADPAETFVLSATAQTFNLTFDLAWKVMKDILLTDYGIADFATGSPKETLRTAYSVGLIEDDQWLLMLHVRNTLIHDYDGDVALRYFEDITKRFDPLIAEFCEKAKRFYPDGSDGNSES